MPGPRVANRGLRALIGAASARLDGLPWLAERLLLAGGATGFYLLYIPINRWSAGFDGYHPETWLDRAIPSTPGWMYVYAAVFITGFMPMLVIRPRELFRRVVAAYLAVQVVAFACFLLVPVHMEHRPLGMAVVDFPSWGQRLAYYLDTDAACLPSIHVTLAVLAALCTWKADRVMGALGLVLAVLVATSTLMVKQHYLADVLVATALATGSWAWLVVPWRPGPDDRGSLRFHRGWPSLLLIPYAGVVAGLYLLYRLEWWPWLEG
jgi:membrane-associated phospholipid phosphatase